MLLSDRDIRAEIAAGRLGIDPFDDEPGAAVERRRPARQPVPGLQQHPLHPHRPVDAPGRPDHASSSRRRASRSSCIPASSCSGSTLERCTLPDDLAGRLEGKSSLGRLGLLTHSTAGFIDPGFTGHITLELSNVANLPITLWPGMKIGQLCLLRLTSPAENPYGSAKAGSKYQGQRGPTPSRSYQNFIKSSLTPPTLAGIRTAALRVSVDAGRV